jgi:hypothetical protein
MENKEFVAGFIIGIVCFGALLIWTGATPKDESKRWEMEVIKRGYAEMVVKDDRLEFQWKEQP